MARNWIVVGDTTNSGGTVVSGSPTDDIGGKPWARVGDKVICGRHGATSIVSGDATTIVSGQPAARHGDFLACGCKLISTSQTHAFVDPGGGGNSKGGGGGNSKGGGAGNSAATAASVIAHSTDNGSLVSESEVSLFSCNQFNDLATLSL